MQRKNFRKWNWCLESWEFWWSFLTCLSSSLRSERVMPFLHMGALHIMETQLMRVWYESNTSVSEIVFLDLLTSIAYMHTPLHRWIHIYTSIDLDDQRARGRKHLLGISCTMAGVSFRVAVLQLWFWRKRFGIQFQMDPHWDSCSRWSYPGGAW